MKSTDDGNTCTDTNKNRNERDSCDQFGHDEVTGRIDPHHFHGIYMFFLTHSPQLGCHIGSYLPRQNKTCKSRCQFDDCHISYDIADIVLVDKSSTHLRSEEHTYELH